MRVADSWRLLAAMAVVGSATAAGPTVNPDDAERQKAFELYRQHNLPESAALFAGVVARYPDDALAHETYASALLGRSTTQPDAEHARADRELARSELLRAQALGDQSDLLKTLLDELPAGGRDITYSSNQAVDTAMREGESAFSQAKWDQAIAAYSRALALDPSQSSAMLFIGDAYFAQHQMAPAMEWYAKSAAANPTHETAYRYWGDALLAQGRQAEARTKYIEAVAAEPYRHASAGGLNKWLNANHLQLKSLAITLPPPPTIDADGKVQLTVDVKMLNDTTSSPAWLAYQAVRGQWLKETFRHTYPQETAYRHSLAEESEALQAALLVYHELKEKDRHHPDPALDQLAQLSDAGLLEPFSLISHADAGVAQDYAAYYAAHRDKLLTYLDRFIVPAAP